MNTLTIDNGGKNNKLSEVLPKEIMYNCHPYCPGEKGKLGNKHGIVRRKGATLENYTDGDIEIFNAFINNYYTSALIEWNKNTKSKPIFRSTYPWNE